MKVTMALTGAEQLEGILSKKLERVEKDLNIAMRDVTVKWHFEAAQRIPVETGLARNTLMREYGFDGGSWYAAVGTNQFYGKFIEFGTRFIARGRVKALGTSPEITDAQAIKLWPAKNYDLVDEVSGKANMRAIRAIDKRLEAGGAQEQMPWLRPSFMKIREWTIQRISKVFGF